MNYNMKEVGTRIKQLRKEKGLTQEQLAENLDITAGTIGKIEIGRTGHIHRFADLHVRFL